MGFGNWPNFTIADCSASTDCENWSFGHSLEGVLDLRKMAKPMHTLIPRVKPILVPEKSTLCRTHVSWKNCNAIICKASAFPTGILQEALFTKAGVAKAVTF